MLHGAGTDVRTPPHELVRAAEAGRRRRRWTCACARKPARGNRLHIDFDVLDEAVFPAVDYSTPGGLSWNELTTFVHPFLSAGSLIGVSTACYNPDKEADDRSSDFSIERSYRATSNDRFSVWKSCASTRVAEDLPSCASSRRLIWR
ncbi:arginase family protein [Methylosinus sporium]|uniref:arginase family protein n=1 Tax=Methylosinus sporium TaxID=428 RepID=UPI00383A8E31